MTAERPANLGGCSRLRRRAIKGTLRRMPHHLPIRIYYEDTDAGGIVYHASFLRFAERGRSEFLRSHGISNSDLLPGHGFHFVVRHISIDYRSPGKLDDLLALETTVVDVGNASFTMHQNITRDGQPVCDMKVVLVCVNAAGKAIRVPEMLRTILRIE